MSENRRSWFLDIEDKTTLTLQGVERRLWKVREYEYGEIERGDLVWENKYSKEGSQDLAHMRPQVILGIERGANTSLGAGLLLANPDEVVKVDGAEYLKEPHTKVEFPNVRETLVWALDELAERSPLVHRKVRELVEAILETSLW